MGLEVEEGTFTRDVHRHHVNHAVSEGEQLRSMANHDQKKEEDLSVEELYAATQVPPWWAQITARGMVVSAALGSLFCVITHKLNLTTGVIPSLNVSAGLLGFFFIRLWTGVLSKVGVLHEPFTRQENTVIQTCVVACYGLAFSGGFGSYIIGMDQRTYDLSVSGDSSSAESPADVKNPSLGWLFGYMFAVSFLGLLAVVPLRKIMIIDYKLTYPSGTATAVLINSFHTPQGAEQAKKQIKYLGKYFSISVLWSFFKWFYSGGDKCGFDNFPTLGLKARDNRFYFDFSLTYVGAGMICPHLVNCSILLGGILSWGLMWPLIGNRVGDWYPAKYKTGSNLKGPNGYRVFVMIALILGDGLYNFVKITGITTRSIYLQYKKRQQLPIITEQNGMKELNTDEQIRNEMFMKDRIPNRVAFACYIALAAVSIGVIPKIFSQMKWYYVLISYCMAPLFAFCNAYGCGLTDWSLASSYGKLALFIFASWAGSNGGVIVGLASCGVMMVIVACAADLMQDFKTGYLTKSSPRSMFASQVLGTLMGCIIAPLTFWLYWKAYTIGDPTGEYQAPYALLYREMAIIGVQGFSSLPKYCLDLCYSFFAAAIVINFIRDMAPSRVARFIPIPMAMAIPFYIGAYFAIDMFVGTVIVFVWQQLNRKKADLYVPAVAAGLLCGDGVWTLISSILSLAKVQPPICMYFYSRKAAKVLGL